MKFIIELLIAALMLFGIVLGIELALNAELRQAALALPKVNLVEEVELCINVLNKLIGYWWPIAAMMPVFFWWAMLDEK